MSAIEDRRQRAREAYYDEAVLPEGDDGHAIEPAIESATQVKITDEMVEILRSGGASDVQDLKDIFTAAGFEVIE